MKIKIGSKEYIKSNDIIQIGRVVKKHACSDCGSENTFVFTSQERVDMPYCGNCGKIVYDICQKYCCYCGIKFKNSDGKQES